MPSRLERLTPPISTVGIRLEAWDPEAGLIHEGLVKDSGAITLTLSSLPTQMPLEKIVVDRILYESG